MMQVGFFEKLKAFNKEEFVHNDKLQKIVETFMMESPDFKIETVQKSSKACFSLFKWCIALTNYAEKAKAVYPDQQKVKIKEEELKIKKKELAIKQAKVKEEMIKVD